MLLFLAAIHLAALAALFPSMFSWSAIGVAVFLHWLTGGVGITLGYHRLITHKSFQTPKWLEYVILFCGTVVYFVAEPDLMVVTILVLLMAGYDFWSDVFRKKNGNGNSKSDSGS